MAQRQFRSDDTSKWVHGYGNRRNGDWSPTTQTLTPIDSAFTGLFNQKTGNASNASFETGQLVIIINMFSGEWELNRIKAYDDINSIVTFQHGLTHNYLGGCQIVVMPQYKTVNIASGQVITGKSFNGTTGGIAAFFADIETIIAGSIRVNGGNGGYVGYTGGGGEGGGFRGGHTSMVHNAWYGDGSGGLRNASGGNRNNNGSGGGSGGSGDSSGGGGGHANPGGNGSVNPGGFSGGYGGSAVGNADLTLMFMGGGGGGGSQDYAPDGAGAGAAGGGIVLIISPKITITGGIQSNGGTGGGNDVYLAGGGGAGGSILLKGLAIVLGAGLVTATGGSGGLGGGTEQDGGSGSVGRIHADYAKSITGSTSPTITVRQDKSLFPRGSAAALMRFVK